MTPLEAGILTFRSLYITIVFSINALEIQWNILFD
jgi:hypothetical protein